MEMLLRVIAGTILGPMITALLKRFSWIDESLGSAINFGVCLALYLGAWWTMGHHDPATLEEYVGWAMAAAGLGGALNNVWRKKLAPNAPV